MSSTSQNPEVFVVRDELGPILYAPLSRSMARLNESAAQTALRYSENNQLILDVDEQAVIDSLAAHKFFEAAHTPRNDIEFAPVQVTLFPTNRCNLRCTYCYADGGEGGGEREPITTLDIDAGKAAIDLVAKNAIELSKTDYPITNFLVSFHGNGEPFSAFDTLKELVYYAVDVSESVDFPVVLNVATNGVLTVEQLDFLLAYFSNVNISFDGLPDVQNVQRPLSDGGESFSRVDNTLRRLNDSTVEFGIRATITDKTIGRISEMAHFVYDNYPRCQQLHLEPVWECGRCLKTQTETPEVDQFINQYLKAIGEQGNDGLRLTYSGARQDILTDAFCKVSSGGFTVTPTGDVTSCFEVSYRSDPRSETYMFGTYNRHIGQFEFDGEKLDQLAKLNVRNMPYCSACFCKWHCAGDCAAKLLGAKPPENHEGSNRCKINRRLTLKQIQRRLDWSEDGDQETC